MDSTFCAVQSVSPCQYSLTTGIWSMLHFCCKTTTLGFHRSDLYLVSQYHRYSNYVLFLLVYSMIWKILNFLQYQVCGWLYNWPYPQSLFYSIQKQNIGKLLQKFSSYNTQYLQSDFSQYIHTTLQQNKTKTHDFDFLRFESKTDIFTCKMIWTKMPKNSNYFVTIRRRH